MADVPEETTTETPAEPVEPAAPAPEVADPEPKSDVEEAPVKEPTTPEPSEPEPKETVKSQAEEPSEDDEPKPVDDKRHNDEMARQRIQSRAKTERQVAKQLDQAYGPKAPEDFIAEGLSEQEAKIEARLNQLNYETEKNRIVQLNGSLREEAQQVYREFPMFDPKSPEYDKDFSQKVQERYARVARLEQEQVGPEPTDLVIVNAEEPLYDFYAEAADFYAKGTTKGASKGQQDTLKMMSRVEKPSGNSEPQPEKKPEEMSISEMEQKYGIVRR